MARCATEGAAEHAIERTTEDPDPPMTVTVQRSALVAHPATRVFDLIEAAEHYPAFLPWCAGATVLERRDELVSARLDVAWHGVHFSIVTRNPKRRPTWMAIGLQHGPFRRFEGEWRLTPLGDRGCRVAFSMAYEFNASLLDPLAGPMFRHVTDTLMDAFVARADALAAQAGGAAGTDPARPAAGPADGTPSGPAPAPPPPTPT